MHDVTRKLSGISGYLGFLQDILNILNSFLVCLLNFLVLARQRDPENYRIFVLKFESMEQKIE